MADETKSSRATAAAEALAAPRQHRSSTPAPSAALDISSVLAAYARWAPVYDWVFGRVFEAGRRAGVAHINGRQGRLLEVGVGTGITLPCYSPHLKVTGIDLSPEMLAKARRRVERQKIATVEDLREMDATALDFPDGAFETVAVMYTITVVPRPDAVMAEVERVTAPGGEVILVSHFASESGWRQAIERRLAPFTRKLGWRPDFPVDRVLGRPGLELVETRRIGLFGIFTLLRLRRKAA